MFPIFFENSNIPVWLSKIAPIEINAITLGPAVFSRGKVDSITRNHESIHWAQYKECLVLLFPILYVTSYLINLAKGMKGDIAYRNIWFEIEAYNNDDDLGYLNSRVRWAWARRDKDKN
jgi:hypothetical protein